MKNKLVLLSALIVTVLAAVFVWLETGREPPARPQRPESKREVAQTRRIMREAAPEVVRPEQPPTASAPEQLSEPELQKLLSAARADGRWDDVKDLRARLNALRSRETWQGIVVVADPAVQLIFEQTRGTEPQRLDLLPKERASCEVRERPDGSYELVDTLTPKPEDEARPAPQRKLTLEVTPPPGQ